MLFGAGNRDYVMVLEDDRFLLEVILEHLILAGFSSEGFPSGDQALRYMYDTENIPSLIWLDYYLQDTNGLVFSKILKNNPEWVDIPIVVVSAHPLDDYKQELLDLGVCECLLKGEDNIRDIVQKVKKLVG